MKYLKYGSSENFIVFLHGWGADKNSFLWTKDYLKNYSLVYIDFRGFGDSDEPEKPWSVFDYVQDVKNLLDGFNISSLILVGHSFGGRVAIKFSFLYQNEYDDFKLCLVDSAGIKPRRNLLYYYKIFKFKILKKIAKRIKIIENYVKKCGSSDYKKLSPLMKETFKMIVNEDLSYDAKYITKSTLLIWGRKDKETKLYMARKLKKLICFSKLHIIDNAGHFCFLDNPKEFLIVLDTFIKN